MFIANRLWLTVCRTDEQQTDRMVGGGANRERFGTDFIVDNGSMNLYHGLCGCVRIRLSRSELRRQALDRVCLNAARTAPQSSGFRPRTMGVTDRHSHRSPFRTTTPGPWFLGERAA